MKNINVNHEPSDAWIILYITYDTNDWYGAYPGSHHQWYYTPHKQGLPQTFESYQEADNFGQKNHLHPYIIIPIAGIPADRIARDQAVHREMIKKKAERDLKAEKELPF